MKITEQNSVMIAIDFQTSLVPVMHKKKSLINKTVSMAKGIRMLNIPIIVTQQYTKGLGDTDPVISEAIGDYEYIDKTAFSCCRDEKFMDAFRALGKKHVIITGIEAHICVLQTVLDFLDDGINVYIVADCVSSRNKNDMKYAIRRMAEEGAVITTSESILFEIMKDAKHPARKGISAIIK